MLGPLYYTTRQCLGFLAEGNRYLAYIRILLWFWFARYTRHEHWKQTLLIVQVEARKTHFDVQDGEVLQQTQLNV